MSLDIDQEVDLALAKDVTLAGRIWKIAPMPLRQVLRATAIAPRLRGITIDNATEERLQPIVDFIMCGLKKAYPDLSLEEFLDQPVTLKEMMTAIPIIMLQAGGEPAAPADGAAAGEA